MESWSAVLSEMERRLAEAELRMDFGGFSFEPVPIPVALGPMPAEYRDRAEALYIATVEVEGRVSAAMAAIAGQIRRPAGVVAPSRPEPSYVDLIA